MPVVHSSSEMALTLIPGAVHQPAALHASSSAEMCLVSSSSVQRPAQPGSSGLAAHAPPAPLDAIQPELWLWFNTPLSDDVSQSGILWCWAVELGWGVLTRSRRGPSG